MQIEIPQYISAYVAYGSGRREVRVFIGDTLVYTMKADIGNPIDDEEDLKWEAVTAFGRMLALKIGD